MADILLGGSASPLGWSVQYLDARPEDVIRCLCSGHEYTVRAVGRLPASLNSLLPFEAPWTRELVMSCGAWTAYLNNFLNGGDLTARGLAVSRDLGVRCVAAEHTPRYGPGHQATQLWVLGPDGEPPLMYRRTICAVAEDGRWNWGARGEPFAFEDLDRYRALRIRDRFDRPMLVDYLHQLGIPADDSEAYGEGVLLQRVVDWPRRRVTLDEARQDLR